MQVISHRKHAVNITRAERWACAVGAVGGGVLAGVALRRRSPVAIALGFSGAELLRRAISAHGSSPVT